MALTKTDLVITSSPLPADFIGKPQDLYDAMVQRLSIQSPSGTIFFVIGDVEPSTNQGPWLKNGTKWYVFSTSQGKYIPLDITDSFTSLFVVSASTPAGPVNASDPTIWLRTFDTRVLGWFFWDGAEWRPGGNTPPSGTTAERPVNPQDLEQYFDTDINAMLHWERGAWRTISGTPGDVKFVTTQLLADALVQNPGWSYLGQTTQSWRGASLGVAAKDPGTNPASAYAVDTGRTQRAAAEVAGEETHILTDAEMVQHTHLVGSLNSLGGTFGLFYRVDDGESFSAPATQPPNYAQLDGPGTDAGKHNGILPGGGNGTTFVTSKQLTIAQAPAYGTAAVAHNNLPPTLYLWALAKD